MKNTIQQQVSVSTDSNGSTKIAYKTEVNNAALISAVLFSGFGGLFAMLMLPDDMHGWITYGIMVVAIWFAIKAFQNGVARALGKVRLLPGKEIHLTNQGILSGNHNVPFKDIDNIGVRLNSDGRTAFVWVESNGSQVPVTLLTSPAQAKKVMQVIVEKAETSGFAFN